MSKHIHNSDTAYDGFCAECPPDGTDGATMTASQPDPMEGAIKGLMHVMEILDGIYRNSNLRTQTSLALNEAYRNGLKAGRAENGIRLSTSDAPKDNSPSEQR